MSNRIKRISRERVLRDAVYVVGSVLGAVGVTVMDLVPGWLDAVVTVAWWVLAGLTLKDLIRSAYGRWSTVEAECAECSGTGVIAHRIPRRFEDGFTQILEDCAQCSGAGHVAVRRA